MATNIGAANLPEDDIELGQHRNQHNVTHNRNYVRDITYKIIPFCCVFLVVFSVGAILISTLEYEKPVPQQATIVISSMLGAFFLLFCIGGTYLYHKKHYPPLIKGPNCPDRPEPSSWNPHRTLKTMSRTFRRKTKYVMNTIRKKSSSYSATTTASRLRHHEQEVPDHISVRAISPDTFRAESRRRDCDWDEMEHIHDRRRQPSPAQGYHEPTRTGRTAHQEPMIRNKIPGSAYPQSAMSSQQAWPSAPRAQQNCRTQAPHLTRRPLPNAHLAHPHSPQHASHLRYVNTIRQDDNHLVTTPRGTVTAGVDPALADHNHNVRVSVSHSLIYILVFFLSQP
ncbi:hypothetical protein F4810DRAFT_663070 [Camillea tinctor]|nr:hypothetical protein F4810DRAFT_663070 [Camillea tinctor]